ncbi:MAG: hypothetical protein IJY47_04445 [Clostridia bacterium]|nr:hypothetical protein [Clostridia bacterium]
MKRTGSIDYLKFLFSIVILLYHYGLFFQSGYIVVEGFFMITGYLMMVSLSKGSSEGELSEDSTAKFVLHKYKAVFLPLLFSAISGFLIYEGLIYDHELTFTARCFPLLLFEVIPLQMAGFEGMWTTGVSWYLSAMLLGIAILHPFAKKAPLRFGCTAAPVIALLGYGLLSHRYGHLDVPNLWILDLVNTGLLRGIAGLCGGFVLYFLVSRGKGGVTLPRRILYSLSELGGWYVLIRTMAHPKEERIFSDFILTAVIFLILYMILSGKTFFSLLPSSRLSRVLATVSTYIYLNHYPWSVYLDQVEPNRSPWGTLPRYLLLVALSSGIVWGLTTLVCYSWKKYRAKG